MTLKEFRLELSNILEDVMETAQGINDERGNEALDTQQLRTQIQSVAEAAWNAASEAMDTAAIVSSRVLPSERHLER